MEMPVSRTKEEILEAFIAEKDCALMDLRAYMKGYELCYNDFASHEIKQLDAMAEHMLEGGENEREDNPN